ncbi:hypothetical protein ACFE04_007878 [Oxalis oulophora]
MEVVIPPRSGMDFDFNSTPYASAPSTPKRFGDYYFSAPTSPSHLTDFYRDFDDFCLIGDENDHESKFNGSSSSSAIPFSWEEKPGTPRLNKGKSIKDHDHDHDDDFAFEFGVGSDKPSLSSADELFDNGKIKPILKLPPRLQLQVQQHEEYRSTVSSPTSPRSPKWRGIRDALKKKKESNISIPVEQERGRTRMSSSSGHRSSRSLSPLRISEFAMEQEKIFIQQRNKFAIEQEKVNKQSSSYSSMLPPPSPSPSPSTSKSSSRKWRLKDLFLFRSSSEGRSVYKHPHKGYTNTQEDVKADGSSSKRRSSGLQLQQQVSAHHMQYNLLKKATNEEMRKKTSLAYKQGFLGSWFSFNPTLGRS